jgi:hypothetical protein
VHSVLPTMRTSVLTERTRSFEIVVLVHSSCRLTIVLELVLVLGSLTL